MSFRATVPALYRWGFTSLPCIRASWIVLFCSSVQSSTRWPNSVLSLSGEKCRGLAAFCPPEGKLYPSCGVLCEPPAAPGGPPSPPAFLHLLGSSPSPSSSRPRFLLLDPPALPPLVPGPSPRVHRLRRHQY